MIADRDRDRDDRPDEQGAGLPRASRDRPLGQLLDEGRRGVVRPRSGRVRTS